eukprot:15348724-Ditylum_brightwellii.AAC.1
MSAVDVLFFWDRKPLDDDSASCASNSMNSSHALNASREFIADRNICCAKVFGSKRHRCYQMLSTSCWTGADNSR